MTEPGSIFFVNRLRKIGIAPCGNEYLLKLGSSNKIANRLPFLSAKFHTRLAYDTSYTDLLKRLSDNDRNAFEILFKENYDIVYSTALVMTKSSEQAGDIAQDVFLSLWENRKKITDVENIKGFLCNSVKFLVLKRLRRLKVEEAYRQYLAYTSSLTGLAVEEDGQLITKQLESSILQGVSQLPPRQQLAFRLSREKGLSHKQISEIIGVNKKTVKDYIVRSIAFLRQHLHRHSNLLLLSFLLFF